MKNEEPLWRVFGRIGVLSFGGPAAQIALMHRELVDLRGWLSEREYLRALSFCMLLPGPEAMQLATYAGWKLDGIRGGLIAGGLFVLPGAIVILCLAALYAAFGQVPLVAALFLGVKAAVVVIVIEALLRVARRAFKGRTEQAIAVGAFVAIFALGVPFPLIILAAAAIGAAFLAERDTDPTPLPAHPGLGATLAAGLGLWWAPVAALALVGQGFLVEIGLFFSKLAVVTFGGAYAVLAYMTQTVVQDHGWLTTAAMMDALGLAETTPGPLILVTEFVAFLAGHSVSGPVMAIAAAGLALWVTFVPCFLWVFAFAPYIEWIASRPRLAAALSGVSAAVVGIIANLALWFALHLFFARLGALPGSDLPLPVPDLATFQWKPALVALVAGTLLLRRHWPLIPVLGAAALGGLALSAAG
ncbi:putative chromate transport protein [Defluviimonas aquaemixtae]|uniref:Putative chromate transport protein n=1 Tax=Albidovulum aquaemixtae TaxID=1542388 RepID=A0A2R8B6L1_9RHOB|nr:chromate efflux transporter [Defluviimonas aquaemixtae]SPH18291.1 putative chromate transport protein [Defluviimonas aquaemixtae]